MTVEEASVIIGNIPINGDECYSIPEYQQAKAMAIKALEQQPCEDCVSRQEAILQVQRYGVGCFDAEEFSPEQCERFVIQKLNELPPVTPKEKTEHWIQQPRYDGDDQPDLVCPNCGFKISWWDMGNFCAKCGTGLEGGAG